LHRDLVRVKTVEFDHVLDDPRMTRLLERLELERLAEQDVRLQCGAGTDHGPRVLLGLKRVRPEGKASQQLQGLSVQRGPLELLGRVRPMLIEEGPAEELLVRVRPYLHRSGPLLSPRSPKVFLPRGVRPRFSPSESARGTHDTAPALRPGPTRTASANTRA